MLSSRDVLIYASIISNGEWHKTFNLLRNKEFELPDEDEVLLKINSIGSKVITIFDEEYPRILLRCNMPPFVIYYHGDISLLNKWDESVGVIGTRHPSEYGIEMTRKIVSEIADRYIIISGLAYGIDSIAHDEALNRNGRTIAVLGSGINNCYPNANNEIYEKIIKKNLVISEYPDKVEPSRSYFPLRNRIIASLSKTLVVTEARKNSGTSITVGFALQGQANVCAVPYPALTDSLCNILLKEGAGLVECGEDVIFEMNDTKFRKKICAI